ncbi:uncharacterized protein LOC142335428 [Convolutriloba macropyga]|uniref:uncharacterized protein LOC142335428 n=1 Tax=Convolutriloba macropyga TaxID=536237 RepID=UPI003F527CA9
MYGEDDARKLLLVKIGVLGCVCLVFSLLVHGPYSVDTTTFHYGIWRYCIEATDNCSPVDDVLHNRWQRELNGARFFLIASHVVYIVSLIVTMVALVGAGLKRRQASIALMIISFAAFVFLVIGMSLVTDVISETLDTTSDAKVSWSFVIPWIGTALGFLQILECMSVCLMKNTSVEAM